MVMPKGCVSHK